MQKKNTTRRKARPKLTHQHYAIYWLILWSLDYEGKEEPGGAFRKLSLPDYTSADVRRQLKRLARLAGVPEQQKASKTFDDAMKAIYLRARAEADFDTGPAFRIAERIKGRIAPYEATRRAEANEPLNSGEQTVIAAARDFGPEAIEELLRLVAEGGHSRGEILRRVRKLIKQKDDTDERLEELRERLHDLEEEGEAHNEAGVFKLRREIYDLEHPEEARDDWNDWSAWEEGGAR
jgi:hypothetical protein